MKIVAISDLHGILPEIHVDAFDVLCICGDIFPCKIQENMPKCSEWITEHFIPWCDNLPCKKILIIAGNHDFWFERTIIHNIKAMFYGTKITYLQDSSIEIGGVIFYGTPYCKIFGRWAFMKESETLHEIFSKIPENVDILLTHDAPYGTSDICVQGTSWTTAEHIGNIELRDAILKKSPKIVLHGHLHSSNHRVELMNDTEVYNVSIVDEHYDLSYLPLVLNIDEK